MALYRPLCSVDDDDNMSFHCRDIYGLQRRLDVCIGNFEWHKKKAKANF